MTRTLFDCPAVPLSPVGPLLRVIVATHPATSDPPAVGEQRAETVYEFFVSTLPSPAFSAKDVLDLYLHRGSFETVLADEDGEQDADRWVSHTAWGQECFQILAQWLWNLRLELGQHLAPATVRTTEFAPAHAVSPAAPGASTAPVIYGPPQWAKRSFTGGFPGSAFTLQPDGTDAFVPLIIRFTRKSADPNTMALCVSCMQAALASAVFAPCASSVKNILPPKNHAASVLSSGLCLLILSLLLPCHPCRLFPPCLRPLPCSGAIGLVALCAATGPNSCGEKRSPFPGRLPHRQHLLWSQARRC